MQLEPGTKIRILEDEANASPVSKGDTGAIESGPDSDGDYYVEMDGDGVGWYFAPDHFEVIPDRVTVCSLRAALSALGVEDADKVVSVARAIDRALD